jgi:hypothetical protein
MVSFEKPHLANVQQTCSISGWGSYFCLSLAVVTYAPQQLVSLKHHVQHEDQALPQDSRLGRFLVCSFGSFHAESEMHVCLTVYALSWCSVGKTSLQRRYVLDRFGNYAPTIGIVPPI